MLLTPVEAIGSIRPDPQFQGDVLSALGNPGFYRQSSPNVLACMDGRPEVVSGLPVAGQCLTGGSVSVAVATAHLLSSVGEDRDFLDICDAVAWSSYELGFPLGVHRADCANGCGCGAADGLASVLSMASDQCRQVRALANVLGLDAVCTPLSVGAAPLPLGVEIVDRLVADGAHCSQLRGPHCEQAVLVNFRTGVALDRPRLSSRFGGAAQVFTIDAWLFPRAAKVALKSAQKLAPEQNWFTYQRGQRDATAEAAAALTSFSVAAVMVLCAPGMPIVSYR